MAKKVFLIAGILLLFFQIYAQYGQVLDDKVQLKSEDFIQTLIDADNIILGTYIQGGKTKAKVRVESAFIGDAKEDIVINNLDNEKIRLRLKRDEYKKGDQYIFILKKEIGRASCRERV